MLVADVMSHSVMAVSPDDPIQKVASAMERHGVGALVVAEEGVPRGIVTDRDLTIRALARGLGPEVAVRDVMTTEPATVSPSDDLDGALRVMRLQSVRRTPVVEGGRLVGIISICDIVVNAAELREAELTFADLCERETEAHRSSDEDRAQEARHP